MPRITNCAQKRCVTRQNQSVLPHTAASDPAQSTREAEARLPGGSSPWDSGELYPRQKWSPTFEVPGDWLLQPHPRLNHYRDHYRDGLTSTARRRNATRGLSPLMPETTRELTKVCPPNAAPHAV